MASAVSQLNSFHSASQTQLRVLNSSVRSKQDMHTGRHMQSPTMMRSAVTARRAPVNGGIHEFHTSKAIREQLEQSWRVENSGRTLLVGEAERRPSSPLSERIEGAGTLPLGGLATPEELTNLSTVAHLERCMQESAETGTSGLSLPSPGKIASSLLEATIKLAGTSEIDARRTMRDSISKALQQQALKKGIDPASIKRFEDRQHTRHIENSIREYAEKSTASGEIETASAVAKGTPQIDLRNELIRVEPKAMTKAELLQEGREFQNWMKSLEDLPIGSTTPILNPKAEVIYFDISGSSAASEKHVSQDHELVQGSNLGLLYENKIGARASSGLALEAVSHCAQALSEAYNIPRDFFIQIMGVAGDGCECLLPPGATQIVAPILHAFKEKIQSLELGLSSKNLAFHVSGSESSPIQLEQTKNGLKLSFTKMVDEAIKGHADLFSINFDGTPPADLSLYETNIKQEMIPLQEGKLAIGLVFTVQDEQGLALLEKVLRKNGITESAGERNLKQLFPESHDNLQSSFNPNDGNVLGFIDHRMFLQLKSELIKLEDHGVQFGMTTSNKMYAATILSAEGEPEKIVLATDLLTHASINLKTKVYWRAFDQALPGLMNIAENLGITQLDKQVEWIQGRLDAFTQRAKMFNPQRLLESVREGLEPAAQKEYKNAVVSFFRGGLASLVPA